MDSIEEAQPTFFWHRNKEKLYNLDYCLLHGEFLSKDFSIKVGNFDDWIKLSNSFANRN